MIEGWIKPRYSRFELIVGVLAIDVYRDAGIGWALLVLLVGVVLATWLETQIEEDYPSCPHGADYDECPTCRH